MAGKRIKQVLTEFNIGMSTLVNFLEKKGIAIDANPMAKLDENAYALVQKEFLSQQQVKEDAKKIAGSLRIPESEKKTTYQLEKEEKPKEKEKEKETFIETAVEAPKAPTVLGKIDLGKFDKKAKEEPKEEKKAETAEKKETEKKAEKKAEGAKK